MSFVLHSKPWVTGDDVEGVAAVLRSGMIGQGECAREFEKRFARRTGAAGGVSAGSGTAALQLALRALGVARGDEVVVPSYVCVSVLEAVVTTGATPILCDVGPWWVVTSENVARWISKRTRAIIVPHMYGYFADVASFAHYGVPVIEDCAQAVGDESASRVRGRIGMYSFHPTKCLTTGEGGMAVSTDPSLVERMRELRDGSAVPGARVCAPLSDLAAALGLSQLARYPQFLERRRVLAAAYRDALEHIVPECLPDARCGDTMHFRFPLKVPGGLDAHQAAFAERKIHVRRGVDSLLHRVTGLGDGDFPNSTAHYDTTVSLPLYPALTDDEHGRCLDAALQIFSRRRAP